MEYILFSFVYAGLPASFTGICNKIRDSIRLVVLITFIIVYHIDKWETADINVGLFICWCALWSIIWDYLYKKFRK